MLKKILVPVIILFISLGTSIIKAQENDVFKKELILQSKSIESRSFKNSKKSITSAINPSYRIGGTGYPVPERNFAPNDQLSAAGDLNGDGFQDFYYTVAAADETTEDLTDQIVKTVILYGSDKGLSSENDLLIREGLSLIGDLTNDGIKESFTFNFDSTLIISSDISGGEFSNIVKKEIPVSFNSFPIVKSYGDYNNDGFNDWIVYDTTQRDSISEVLLIYGNNELENISVHSFMGTTFLEENDVQYNNFLFADFDKDGEDEIIQISQTRSDGETYLVVKKANDSDELIEIQRIQFNISSSSLVNSLMGISDLNNDGFEELIFETNNRIIIWEQSSGDLYFKEYNAKTFGGISLSFSIIGDFNGDDYNDLLIQDLSDVNKVQFVLGGDHLSNLAIIEPNLSDGQYGLISNYSKTVNTTGDFNNDGLDDLVLEFSTDTKYGYRTYLGNKSLNFSNPLEVSYPLPYIQNEYVYYTFNAGDFNGDGVEDYGITYIASNDKDEESAFSRVELFYGGDLTKSTPDLVISHPDKVTISAPSSGDFNGDGFSDIILNYRNKFSGINIYFGGLDPDNVSDYELTFSELFPTLLNNFRADEAFSGILNIGDINNDGTHDFAFSSEPEGENTFIIYGAENISSSPDLTIPYYATNFVAVDDINGDDIHDFALSFLADGFINIYSGFDQTEGNSFNISPLIKYSKYDYNEEDRLDYLGITMDSGDYNGDGYSDIAAAGYTHFKAEDNSLGADAVYIFLGGVDLSGEPNYSFALKTEYFLGYGNTTETDFYLTRHIGELTTVPDLNDDGADEILIGTTPDNFGAGSLTNAYIYMGNNTISEIKENEGIRLNAPNKQLGLGAHNNNVLSQMAHSGIGDFDNDGNIDIIMTQGSDLNFVKDPVYIYSSENFIASNTDEKISTPKVFELNQNYPNPFNPSTQITFSTPSSGKVKLQVYDITGRLVSTLVDEVKAAGNYSLNFNASGLSSGVYFYRLSSLDGILTKKMTLIK